ncbi:c-type cytochrome [Falsiroseomonas sp.]|uniref:c-type cytochrome n=1 Tax=Falsiroseomonas sp. TaxID=2870721 RepID=UPI0035668DCA
MRAALLLALLLGIAGGAAGEALLGVPPQPGQVAAGRAVAAGGGQQGQAGACFRCHGFAGAAQDAAGFPAIGGMSAEYLHEQLRRYASGERRNDIMSPIASALTPAQMRDVAVFYAVQPVPPATGIALADPALLQHGAILSASGSAESGIQACQNCHGPAGIGIWPFYPRLAGQPAAYLAAQLRAWKTGERQGVEPWRSMQTIAQRMSDRDIEAVALYFASIPVGTAPRGVGVLQ